MKSLKIYILRCCLFAPACAGTFWIFYQSKPAAPSDDPIIAYLSVTFLFTLCALCGWIARLRLSPWREITTACMISGSLALGLIMLSDWQATDNLFFISYFYDNDYLMTFQLVGPTIVIVYTGLLCLIPDRD